MIMLTRKLTSLLLNAVRAVSSPPNISTVSTSTNTAPARPGTLDELAAVLVPKIRDELRRKPGATSLHKGARQAALATGGMLLANHIAELKTLLETKRAEAAQLRLIVTSTELGVNTRALLAQHRGEP